MLRARFAVVHVAMLPVQPRMAKLMCQDISAAGHGKSLPYINSLGFVIPNAIGIRIPLIHFCIGKLSD